MTTLTEGILSIAMLLLCIATNYADSATWTSNPPNGDWNSAGNWTPMTVPNGANDTATFPASNQTSVFISANTQVNAIIFDERNFNLTVHSSFKLTISGAGITNNSGFSEAINNAGGAIEFINSASAGDFIIFGIGQNSTVRFSDSASAGGATFSGSGSNISFHDVSTAGNATLLYASFYDSSTAGQASVRTAAFHGSSTAGTAIIGRFTAPGNATFSDSATGGSASIFGGATFADNSAALNVSVTTVGGSIVFSGNSTGDAAHLILSAPNSMNISDHAATGVTVGSIAGDGGSISLGANRLTVGADNLNTTFFGQIQDTPGSGSLAKIGTGTLILANSNTYSGTTVDQGVLRGKHDGAFGGSAQSGDYVNVGANAALTLDSGATNDYIGNSVSLAIVTGSTVNLNFTGAADRVRSLILNGVMQPPGIYGGAMSGAPNQLPQFTGTGTVIATTRAVSRKVHGTAGTFDIDLPLTGTPGIECRSGGSGKDYQIVVTFFDNVTFGSATVISGTGSVASTSGNGTNVVTINVTNVANAQTISVALVNVNDSISTTTFVVPMSVLLGDITGNGVVNGSDVTAVKHTSHAVDASNFRADAIANGVLNSSDVSTVKFNSGTALP